MWTKSVLYSVCITVAAVKVVNYVGEQRSSCGQMVCWTR